MISLTLSSWMCSYTVTGPKLAAFLQEEVVGHPPRPRGPPPKDGSKRSAARARRKEASDAARSSGMQQGDGDEATQDRERDQGDEGEAVLAADMDGMSVSLRFLPCSLSRKQI